MSGKSVYLRTVALLVIMAQTGSLYTFFFCFYSIAIV